MGAHRRFITSEASEASDTYSPLGEYGGFFDITTNRAEEIDDPSILGWLDYVFGGYEKEDLAATPDTIGGTINGEPIPGMAEYDIQQRNADRAKEDIIPFIDDWFKPDDPDLLPHKDIPWGRIAIGAGVVVGGFFVWDKFIRPRFAKKPEGAQ